MQQAAAQKAPFAAYNPLTLINPITSRNVDLHPLPFSGMDGAIAGAGISLYLGMSLPYAFFDKIHIFNIVTMIVTHC